MTASRILVVDDEPDIRGLVQEILEDEGYEVQVAENAAAARDARRRGRPDLILLDIWMPDVDGVTLLKEWTQEGLRAPVVMMSGHGTVETAVEATRLGAYDYIEKPLSLAKLLLTVERALEADKSGRGKAGLQVEQPLEPVGRSATQRELRELVKRIAAHDSRVLFTGEPGSGKRCFARYLHANSGRGPFIELTADELMGDGTAADERDDRLAEALQDAAGGTLFIDEVGDLDAAAQLRLQKALQAQDAQSAEWAKSGVRVIASTRYELDQEVRAGRFREDLYYQLNVVPIRIPPLREHVEDVPDLLSFYVDRLSDRDKLPYRRFSLAAQNRLRNYAWPGNVRELVNLVQRLLLLGFSEEIDVEEVEAALSSSAPAQPPGQHESIELSLELPLREAREHFERAYLLHQLKRANGSVGRLAKLAGMERTHLYRKLKALGIDPKEAV